MVEESSGVGKDWHLTGRMVARDKTTNQWMVVTETPAADAGGAPGSTRDARQQPQEGPTPVGQPEVAPPAAGRAGDSAPDAAAIPASAPKDAPEQTPVEPAAPAAAALPEPAAPAPPEAGRVIATRPIKRDTIQTPSGAKVDVELAVVSLDDLTASNVDDGRINPAYPQDRQPRDRSKGESERQIQRIMQDFNPRLLGDLPTTADGAPVVDASGIVESGNGRTMTLGRIYRDRPDLVQAYQAEMKAQGYDLSGIRNPVVVRVRKTDMTPAQIEAYTRDSNTDTKLSMSAAEQAMADAKAIPASALDIYRGGDIDAAANRDFVRAFMQAAVPENEQSTMISRDGTMSQEAVRRIRAALLARAYGDSGIVEKLIEATDNNIRAIGGALTDIAPMWAKMRAAAESGHIAPEMDQTKALLEAVALVDRARAANRNVIEFVKQPDLLAGDGISPMGQRFLALMFRDTRQWTKPAGRDRMVLGFSFYVEEAMKTAPGADMFGGGANPDGTLDLARKKQEKDDGQAQPTSDLFAAPAAGSNGSSVRPPGGNGARPVEQGATDQIGGQRPEGRPEGVKPEAPPARDTGESLIQRGRDVLRQHERAGDAPFNNASGLDLRDSAEGRSLAGDLAAAKTFEAKTGIAETWVRSRGKATGVEHLVVLAKDGTPLAIMSGERSRVSMHASVWRAGRAGEVAYSVHNHPSSSGPGSADVGMLAIFPGMRMVIAGHDGTSHEMTATKALTDRGAQDAENLGPKNKDSVSAHLEPLFGKLMAVANAEAIQIGKAAGAKDGGEALWRRGTRPIFPLTLERLGLINYTGKTEWLHVMEAEGFDFGDIYGRVSSTHADRLGRAGFDIAKIGDRGGDNAAAGGANAAQPAADRPNRKPAETGRDGDGKGRVPTEPVKPATTGNAAIDGALDDLFGDGDVSGTSGDLERDSGGGPAANPVGGADVPAAGRPSGDGAGVGGKTAGRPVSGRPDIGGLPGGDADALGGKGNPNLAGSGGTERGGVPAGNGGRGNAGGDGRLPDDRGTTGSTASDASGRAGVKRTDAERVRDIKNLFEERLARFLTEPQTGFQEESSALDQRKKEALDAIFNEGVEGLDPASMSDRELFRAIIAPLAKAGLTRDLVAKLQPYLETYLAETRAGRADVPVAPMERPVSQGDRAAAQAKADKIRPVAGDEANIRATLPLLLPEQQDDVLKVERRFALPNGHGMMITNGTGTGKTYSGGGVIKRFVQMGKDNVLILAPSEAILRGWKGTLDALGVPVHQLSDTRDAGRGVTMTTYANLAGNDAIAARKFDLIVPDEAQNLSSNATGTPTSTLYSVRALAGRPGDLAPRSRMLHAKDWAAFDAMKDGAEKTTVYTRLKAREDAEVSKWSQEPRGKVLFLSATPFAYDKSVDYAEGFLFDYPNDGKVGRSNQSGQNLFFTQNFGYRIRYHKLTKPEAAVNSAVFEREFHEKMKRDGVLSGRALQVDVDYDRKFVTMADAVGTKIDAVLQDLREGESSPDKALADGYRSLKRAVNRNFTYQKRMQLLEAIKAKAAVPDIEKHLAMGRKVVVFHGFNVGGGFNPFAQVVDGQDGNAIKAMADLMTKHPDLNKIDFSSYGTPIDTLTTAFGGRARTFNGTVPTKKRLANLAAFNTDGSGVDVLVVQADAGGPGISMHDVTGAHQRVLINLGMPTKPTTSLQQEGRILRVGSVTNAPFRYYTIGTGWERSAFAKTIAERSGTVENLALGNEARTMMDAFIDAYIEAEAIEPSAQDGIGGKARDRRAVSTTPFQTAMTHYFGRAKISGRRDQREGLDFYPTPEPLALKMVEWAGIRPNERVLEPSAGDGAIARYMPDGIDLTMVEPSMDLASRAQLRAPHGKTVESTFEAYHLVNKAHVIVMNPPFGSGGKTAMDHVEKAIRHLRPGGRIVALIPSGPSADARFDNLMGGEVWRGDKMLSLTGIVNLPAVTFERAGTSVMSRIVIIDKARNADELVALAFDHRGNNRITVDATTIKGMFGQIEHMEVPPRPAPVVDAVTELETEGQDASTPVPSQAQAPALSAAAGAFKLAKVVHAKTGIDLFVATAGARVERDVYIAMLAVARAHDGYYSAFRGNGAMPGFQFKTEANRQAFLDDMAKPTTGGFEETGDTFQTSPQLVREAASATEEITRLLPKLRAELDRLDLKRVKLTAEAGAWWQGKFAITGQGAMEITIGASVNPTKTLYHEVIHALRAMNLFTAQEWTALETAAAKGWMEKHDIAKRYPDLSPSQQVEEAIAEEFSEALEAKKAPKGPLLVQAFNKIARLMRAFRNVFNGAGFQTAEDVFGRVLSGEIGARDAGNNGVAADRHQARLVNWGKQVIDLFRNVRLPPVMDMGDVPPVIRRLGGVGRRMVLPTGKAKTISKTHPDLTAQAWLKLPALIANPEMVIDNRGDDRQGDLIVITSESVDDGRPVVVVIKTNGTAASNEAATVVVTVYPKDKMSDLLRKAESGKLIRYVKARRESDGYKHIGANSRSASPLGDTISRLPVDTTILTYSDIFKARDGFAEDDTKFQRPIHTISGQALANRATAMGGAVFVPNRHIWEELTTASAPIWERLKNGRAAAMDAVDRARVLLQDRMLPLRRAQAEIEKASRVKLPEDQNVYLTETTFSGKVGNHLGRIDQDFTKPIIDLIAATKGDLDADTVGTWLYARHAVERNAHIASINPKMPDGGSGMTDAEANSILAQAAASKHAATLDRIGKLIDALRERSLELRVNSGLISHADATMWRSMYKHYVPMKGWAETDHGEATLDISGIGRRFSIGGKESRRALGRQSEAFNPLIGAITQAQEVSIRAEKNVVGRSLYELAKGHPSKLLWEVVQVKQKRYFNSTTGLVETRNANAAQQPLEPNEMAVKISGQEARIVMHDARIARAMTGLGADQMGTFIRFIAPLSRWFSMARTMLNPEFMVKNAIRDFETAQINMLGMDTKGRAKIALAMTRDWRKALMGATRGSGVNANTVWAKHFREFQAAGAQVSFWVIENPKAGKSDLEKRLRLKRGNAAIRGLKRMTALSMRDNIFLSTVEKINLAVDNAIRLAAFVEARNQGMSAQQAAFMSKELTVNFNRRGEYGPTLNVVYPFFNAGMQGSVRLLQALRNPKLLAAMTIGGVGLGLMLDLMNAALSDEDDDGELFYDKDVQDYRNRTNLHVVHSFGGGEAWSLPLAYGYNIFPYAGQQLGKVLRGVKEPDAALADVGAAFLQSWMPTDSLVPGLIDPVLEVASNENYFGNSIYPSDFYGNNKYLPDAVKAKPGTTETSKFITKTLNDLTGGNDVTSGLVDLSPAVMDYMASFAVGSAGSFYGRTFDVLSKTLTGKTDGIEMKDIPFVRIARSGGSSWTDFYRYKDFGFEVRDANDDVKNWPAGSTPPPDVVAKAALYDSLLAAEREINGQGEFRQTDKNGKPNSKFVRPSRPEDVVMMQFNKEFIKVAGHRAE
ncbi:MAG: hypothetical protein IPM06_20065 [Rhizobiales bacterium]|nr:hypothetical protein [Hyphomicrobiales bacterium]